MGGKSTKLKVKRTNNGPGRPRKEGERYASGDIKRSETQREVMAVAIEARRRIDGWGKETPDDKIKSPYAGYVLGRMFLDGAISKTQLEAGDEYAEIMARYYRMVGYPFPSARAQSLFSIKGHDGEENESVTDRARRASNTMMEVTGLLLQCEDGPQVKQMVYNTAVMSYDHLRGMGSKQLLWLRRGLDAIAKRKDLRQESKSVMGVGIFHTEICASR